MFSVLRDDGKRFETGGPQTLFLLLFSWVGAPSPFSGVCPVSVSCLQPRPSERDSWADDPAPAPLAPTYLATSLALRAVTVHVPFALHAVAREGLPVLVHAPAEAALPAFGRAALWTEQRRRREPREAPTWGPDT